MVQSGLIEVNCIAEMFQGIKVLFKVPWLFCIALHVLLLWTKWKKKLYCLSIFHKNLSNKFYVYYIHLIFFFTYLCPFWIYKVLNCYKFKCFFLQLFSFFHNLNFFFLTIDNDISYQIYLKGQWKACSIFSFHGPCFLSCLAMFTRIRVKVFVCLN